MVNVYGAFIGGEQVRAMEDVTKLNVDLHLTINEKDTKNLTAKGEILYYAKGKACSFVDILFTNGVITFTPRFT